MSVPTGGAAMSFASTASISSGLSSSSTSGSVNYTDSASSDTSSSKDKKRGFINPLKKKEVTKALNIDSRFRDNYYNTTSTDYNIKLPMSFEKIVQMELMHLELPLSFYGVTKEKGNNYFWVKVTKKEGASTVYKYFQVELDDGNYGSSQIGTALSDAINNAYYESNGGSYDLSFNASVSEYSNKLTISGSSEGYTTATLLSVELNFSTAYVEDYSPTADNDLVLKPAYETNDGLSIQLKLGWALGYRFSKYTSIMSYEGEAIYENPVPRYLYLVIDDFNNNVNNCMFSAFNSSILNKNILAKIGYGGTLYDIYKVYKVDDGQHFRNYFGPVSIRKLAIKIVDEYGRQVDLNNMDFSFCLAFTCQYD